MRLAWQPSVLFGLSVRLAWQPSVLLGLPVRLAWQRPFARAGGVMSQPLPDDAPAAKKQRLDANVQHGKVGVFADTLSRRHALASTCVHPWPSRWRQSVGTVCANVSQPVISPSAPACTPTGPQPVPPRRCLPHKLGDAEFMESMVGVRASAICQIVRERISGYQLDCIQQGTPLGLRCVAVSGVRNLNVHPGQALPCLSMYT